MSVDGTRERVFSFLSFFVRQVWREKFRRHELVVLFFFQSQKKKRMILAKSATSLFVVESRLPGFGTVTRNNFWLFCRPGLPFRIVARAMIITSFAKLVNTLFKLDVYFFICFDFRFVLFC